MLGFKSLWIIPAKCKCLIPHNIWYSKYDILSWSKSMLITETKKNYVKLILQIIFLVVGILKFTLAKISVHKLHDNIKVEKFLKGFLRSECIKKANNLQNKNVNKISVSWKKNPLNNMYLHFYGLLISSVWILCKPFWHV